MLDEQDRDVGRQGVDGLEDLLPLAFGNAGDRLVEQQHARPAGERQRDLEQAALAVGERMDRLVHDLGEAKARQQRLALGGDRGVVAERAPPARARAAMHGDRERQRRQRRQRVEQLVDLEGADDAAANPLVRGERRDVVAVEQDRPGGRLENAGEQVDQRRLAGAVRADQGVAGAARELERDVVGRRQAAEALDERARREDRRHRLRARAEPRPRSHEALAPDEHQHDQEQAEPEVPVLRRPRRDQVVQQLEDDRAEDAAVEIAGAADDEDEQDLGAAMEVEDVERGEAGRLREQRAGRAGDGAGDRCRPRPAAAAPTGRCSPRAAGCRAAPAARRRTASGRGGARRRGRARGRRACRRRRFAR